MYLRVFLTLLAVFVHFEVDFMVFWPLKPALRAFLGVSGAAGAATRSVAPGVPADSRSGCGIAKESAQAEEGGVMCASFRVDSM